MQVKFGYGLKANILSAIEQNKLDTGDIIISSDTKEIAFVKPDSTLIYLKSRDEVFESLSNAQLYLEDASAYAGETIKIKLEDGKYHTYILQSSDDGYTLEESGSDSKQYVIIGTRPDSGQEQGIIYIDNNVGYIWNGSGWVKVFEDVSSDISNIESRLDEKAPINNPSFTGNVTIGGKDVATQEWVNAIISEIANNSPGVVDGTDNLLPTTDYKAGQIWRVAVAGTYAGETCEAGDLIICLNDYDTSYSDEDFMVIQANINGAVTGAETSVDGNIVIFNGATGKIIKDSNVNISSLNDTISKAHEHTNKTILDSYDKTQTELITSANNYVDTKIGDLGESEDVVSYVNLVVGSGGSDVAEQINEAIATAKAYTDTALTIVEF